MSGQTFVDQLQALGLMPQVRTVNGADYAVFDYEIPVGRETGRRITIGMQVPTDFPATPPPGPHVSPHVLTIGAPGNVHPHGGVHASPLGSEWQYWSRPFPAWVKAGRTAKAYMAHIRRLMETL